MWCVTLVPVRFYVFKVNNRNIRRLKISNLKYQLILFWCCHCQLQAYFTPSLPVSVNFPQVTVSYDDHPYCLSSMLQHCNKSLNQYQKDVIDYIDHYMKDYMGHFYPIWIKHSGVILSYMAPHYPKLRKNRWGNVGPG